MTSSEYARMNDAADEIIKLKASAERLADAWRNAMIERDAAGRELTRQRTSNEALRAALAAIMQACTDGKVCDDVAWFDQIETLWDFCDRMLNGERAAQNQPQEASR